MRNKRSTVLKILFIGPSSKGSTTLQRMQCLKQLGHHVVGVDSTQPILIGPLSLLNRICFRLGLAWDISGANKLILDCIHKGAFDIVWIEKGLTIKHDTLIKIKVLQPKVKLVAYSPDNMLITVNQSRKYLKSIPFYDWHITTKSFNVSDLISLGAQNVYFIEKAFDPDAYHPIDLSLIDRTYWESDIAFLGGYEKPRYEMMLALANQGINITIWGPGWEPFINSHPNLTVKPGWVQAEDAAKVFSSTKINLHFLRKIAYDLQTARSVEIPACGGFMLAERTQEHLGLFDEGIEAEFFDDINELLSKIKYYLGHCEQRTTIAAAGYERCLKSGYRNHDRLNEILDVVTDNPCQEKNYTI